jgi:hypothetical protein
MLVNIKLLHHMIGFLQVPTIVWLPINTAPYYPNNEQFEAPVLC